MKKIEKDLILKDLDYINNEFDIKLQKLNSIVSLFMDEEPEIAKETIDENIRETEAEAQNMQDAEQVREEQINATSGSTSGSTEETIEEIIEKDIATQELPLDIKSLYRKIVMLTHPDKSKNNKNADLYSELYRRTIKAKDDNDKAEIIYIAYKLKLNEVYDVDDEHFGSVKRKIKEKEMSSSNLNLNSFWIWYHTDNPQLKRLMVEQINQMKKRK